MTRFVLVLAMLTSGAGCVFSPADVPATPDAPFAEDASSDGPRPDATGDGPRPDAGDARPGSDARDAGGAIDGRPDAEPPDPCVGGSIPLPLDVPTNGNLSGPSLYEPTCTVGMSTGGEDLYRLDDNAASGVDLVVDVEDKGKLDTVIDVTKTCVGQPEIGSCADVGAGGAGEVVVIPSAPAGRRYVAVDSVQGTGSYTVRAFLRRIVGEGALCSPDLVDTRCNTGLHCLERDGQVACRDTPTITDTGSNDTPCTTATAFSEDGVFSGFAQSNDADVVAIDLNLPAKLRVVVQDGKGGCAADLLVEVLTGVSCSSATVVASDSNSGLGPCPFLDGVVLPPGRSWVRVRPDEGFKQGAGAAYEMELDLQ